MPGCPPFNVGRFVGLEEAAGARKRWAPPARGSRDRSRFRPDVFRLALAAVSATRAPFEVGLPRPAQPESPPPKWTASRRASVLAGIDAGAGAPSLGGEDADRPTAVLRVGGRTWLSQPGDRHGIGGWERRCGRSQSPCTVRCSLCFPRNLNAGCSPELLRQKSRLREGRAPRRSGVGPGRCGSPQRCALVRSKER